MESMTEILEYCEKKNIEYSAIILHGSRAVGFSNEESDYDFLIISEDTSLTMDTFITADKKKMQVEFLTREALEKILDGYEAALFKSIFDLNQMAGRILQGRILVDRDHVSECIRARKQFVHKKELIKRFLYTAMNYHTDYVAGDETLKSYARQAIAYCIGTALLISKGYYWLNLKWQHRFLQEVMDQEAYEKYLRIRMGQKEYAGMMDDVKALIALIDG